MSPPALERQQTFHGEAISILRALPGSDLMNDGDNAREE
jgi:hypothetical protein